MLRWTRCSLALALLTLALLAPGSLAPAPALAQDEVDPPPRAVVDELIERGVQHRQRGEDERALELFRQAYELMPSGRVLAQMGFAEQALGLWAQAHEHLTQAVRSGDEWVASHREVIDGALEVVRERVGRLEVRGGVDGAAVLVDDEPRATLPLTEPIVVTAGTVHLRVSAPGYEDVSRTVTVEAGQLARESVRLVAAEEEEEAAVAGDAAGAGAPELAAPAQSSGGGGDGLLIGGVISLSVAAVSFALAGGAYAVREENARVFEDDSRCLVYTPAEVPRREQCPDELSAIGTAEALIGVGLGLGVALGIAGAVLLGMSGGDDGEERAGLGCGGGPGQIGLACGGRF